MRLVKYRLREVAADFGVAPKEIAEKNLLAVCVEEYCELPVDKNAFKGEIPEIKNMVPFAPFDFFIRRKLFMHNMSHALTAYFGALKGYTYIWEAAADAEIKLMALRALTESSRALSKEYGVPLEELLCFSENLLSRFENKLLGDTVERVGRDTKRKLSENDRFVGAARLCEKHGISPVNILAGLAAGLHFAPAAMRRQTVSATRFPPIAVLVQTPALPQGLRTSITR